jgi:predicted nuclease with TOPRIM domain
MLKKMIILGVVGFVAVAALKGTKFASYVRTEVDGLRDRVDAAIPPEKEITRLRDEIKQLDKDALALISSVAKERVEVRNLTDRVAELTTQQSAAKTAIHTLASAIKNAEGYVTVNGKPRPIDDAKIGLEADVKRYTDTQKLLESHEALLANRTKVRDMLEKQLEELQAQKEALTQAVNAADAELNALKLAQMQSKYQTDGTRLAKIKEDLKALNTKVAVEREKLNLMPKAHEKPTAAPSSGKSVDEIVAPLSEKKPEAPKTGKLPMAD